MSTRPSQKDIELFGPFVGFNHHRLKRLLSGRVSGDWYHVPFLGLLVRRDDRLRFKPSSDSMPRSLFFKRAEFVTAWLYEEVNRKDYPKPERIEL